MEYQGVCIDEKYISEKGNLKLPRNSITKICFKYGFLTPHPILQLILGIIIFIIGILPVYHLYFFLLNGGMFKVYESLIASFIPIGLYLILTSFKKGNFFEIKTSFGNKRIVFEKGGDKSKTDFFLNYARNLGYPIFSEED